MKKGLRQKIFAIFYVMILLITAIFSTSEIAIARTTKKISLGKEISAESLDLDHQYYTFTIKNKMKVKFSVSVEERDYSYDDYDSPKINVSLETDHQEEDINITKNDYWFIKAGTSKEATVVLEAGTYTIRVMGYCPPLPYTLKIDDVSTYADKITIPSKATVRIGSPKKLKVTLTPSKSYSKELTWKSSNTKIATVSKDGTVTAKSNGSCTITASFKGGNSTKCKVTVPAPNLDEKLYLQKFYINIQNFYVDSIGSRNCEFGFFNRFNKDVTYVEFTVFQYDNKGDRVPTYSLFSGTNFIVNSTIEAKTSGTATYYVSDYAQKIKVCVKKIWFKDGKTWTNPLYKTWEKKYKSKYS
ncbi:Ig-like domain-containing protein [Anaerosporobacter sp.]|uniref:Ig-like domain-containing protein n=1 Tax=Anaerosporobacter sp. TaxID=1872529 RepID=UPI00286F89BA|nr:Ig-like domain-containing protein [Anaerosporobacter sp.]